VAIAKIITRKRLILLLVPLGFLALCTPRPAMLPFGLKAGIRSRIAEADRVAIDPTIVAAWYKGPAIQLSGKDKVAEVLGLINFESSYFSWHCMCIGDVALRFYRGDQELIALTFHHGESLRVLDANWAHNTNLNLTPESRTALANWLTRNGYRPPPCSTSTSAS
jgi:hypothetical protein